MKSLAERRDREFYYRAKRLASQSNHSTRVGAFAAHNNKILCGAFNTPRNDPKNTSYGSASYHAEYNCLRMVPDRLLTRITLYIARIGADGKRLPSAPCPRCATELVIRGVREVVYFDGIHIVKERLWKT